jgi:hypothetical protein
LHRGFKTDRRAIFAEASKAQAAANWMHAQQRAADSNPS